MPKGEIKKGNVLFPFHMTPKHSTGKLDIYSRNFTKYRTFTKSLSTGLFSLQNVNDTPRKTKFMGEGMGGKTSLGFNRHQSKINIMGNTKASHEAFFTLFDGKLRKMDELIKKENEKALYRVLSGDDIKNEREKILSLFMDYFEPKKYLQIRNRYNNLLGKDSYLRRMKMIKSKSFTTLFPRKKGRKEKEIEEKNEKNKENNKNNKPIVIPENYHFHEVLNLDLFYEKNRYVPENIEMIYSSPSKKDKILERMSHYYDKEDHILTPVLQHIGEKSNKVEFNGNNLKRKIVKIRKSHLIKKPLIIKQSDEEAFYDADTLPPRELRELQKKKMKLKKKKLTLMKKL